MLLVNVDETFFGVSSEYELNKKVRCGVKEIEQLTMRALEEMKGKKYNKLRETYGTKNAFLNTKGEECFQTVIISGRELKINNIDNFVLNKNGDLCEILQINNGTSFKFSATVNVVSKSNFQPFYEVDISSPNYQKSQDSTEANIFSIENYNTVEKVRSIMDVNLFEMKMLKFPLHNDRETLFFAATSRFKHD